MALEPGTCSGMRRYVVSRDQDELACLCATFSPNNAINKSVFSFQRQLTT